MAALAPPQPWSFVRLLRGLGWGFARIFSILLLALAWEWFARSGTVTPFMLPRLSAVLERIWSDLVAGDLILNTGVTVYRAMAGFLIAGVAGVVLGMAISRGRLVHWFFDPIVSVGFHGSARCDLSRHHRHRDWNPRR
jgi:ABC-type nitrate/sulfonate/bicarbonate transport system permease component